MLQRCTTREDRSGTTRRLRCSEPLALVAHSLQFITLMGDLLPPEERHPLITFLHNQKTRIS